MQVEFGWRETPEVFVIRLSGRTLIRRKRWICFYVNDRGDPTQWREYQGRKRRVLSPFKRAVLHAAWVQHHDIRVAQEG